MMFLEINKQIGIGASFRDRKCLSNQTQAKTYVNRV